MATNPIEILNSLRAAWIKDRDEFAVRESDWWRVQAGVYALDEAIHSIETGRAERLYDQRTFPPAIYIGSQYEHR